jgi:hypothetical protein
VIKGCGEDLLDYSAGVFGLEGRGKLFDQVEVHPHEVSDKGETWHAAGFTVDTPVGVVKKPITGSDIVKKFVAHVSASFQLGEDVYD